MIMQIGKINKA